jgi:hypothetical protein
LLPLLFATTLFLSAALLFLVQPLVGKLLLPLLGGTPAVWNTCLVFFQGLLLAGYYYAHAATDRLGVRRQARWHLALLLLAPAALAAGWLLAGSPLPVLGRLVPVDEEFPVLPVLALLTLAVGAPVLVLATTGPLLQRWRAAAGTDPYVLYAASNAGSLVGLLAYPLAVEPTLSLTTQQHLWAAGVVVYVVLVAWCAALTASRDDPVHHSGVGGGQGLGDETPPKTPGPNPWVEPDAPLPARRVLRWLALAALSSALLNAVTAHLTTDLAPMPLLWVVPLALYLVSFILVFARWPERLHWLVGRVAPMLLLFLVVVLVTDAREPLALVLGLHLGVFFVLTLLCHGELARDRPPPTQLTAFYLYLSLGGVLGGLFTALVAPVVFHRVGVVEYPLALVLAALVRPGPLPGAWGRNAPKADERPRPADVVAPLLLGLATVGLILGVPRLLGPPPAPSSPDAVVDRLLRGGLMFGVPAVLAFTLVRRPARYALALAALLLASALYPGPHGRALYTERNFFGTLRVTRSPDGQFYRLVHGTTQHGQQRIDDTADPPKPLMYYHPTGPAGRVLDRLLAGRRRRVGAVGLGCGAMASYARPGEEWVFWEIDPAVVRVARDTGYFTYLDRCKGDLRIVLGDARRQLEREPGGRFDLLILDAFSSDAIPVHLLTREALALYLDKLAPNGLLLFHVSNRYLDLPPLLARLAEAHDPPLAARVDDDSPTSAQEADGKMRSVWVLLARSDDDLREACKDIHWQPIPARPGPVWTDTFSNLLGVWKSAEE